MQLIYAHLPLIILLEVGQPIFILHCQSAITRIPFLTKILKTPVSALNYISLILLPQSYMAQTLLNNTKI